MKIIEALKKIKDLQVKADDLRQKVARHGADLDVENPVYGSEENQREKVKGWIQSHVDIMQEVADLHLRVMRTNLATEVTIELGGKPVVKTIAEWVVRRGNKSRPGLSALDHSMWAGLTEVKIGQRGLKDGQLQLTRESTPRDVRIRRYFDPGERDDRLELYRSEPAAIDARLEVVNAITDLLD